MINNSSSPLRLRVWRPCRWEKDYLDTNTSGLADMGSYQECIYSWEPVGHPFDSVTSTEKTQILREELIEKFALAKPIQERGIEQLKQVLSVIDEILSHENESFWSDLAEELRQLSNGESINLRQHQLLALRQHIQWVYDTFADVPDVYVSIQ